MGENEMMLKLGKSYVGLAAETLQQALTIR